MQQNLLPRRIHATPGGEECDSKVGDDHHLTSRCFGRCTRWLVWERETQSTAPERTITLDTKLISIHCICIVLKFSQALLVFVCFWTAHGFLWAELWCERSHWYCCGVGNNRHARKCQRSFCWPPTSTAWQTESLLSRSWFGHWWY